MHTSSEQNVYIGEQANSFTDQTTSRRFNRPPIDQPLQYNNLTSHSMNFNRMLNHGIPIPVSGTWHPSEFRQPEYLVLQPTPKRRRTSSGSTGLSRRYCTPRNGNLSGGLPMHSSRNLSHMSEIADHHFIRSLDSRNSENICQRNIFVNAHPIHQHWPHVLPTSQQSNRWHNELQQVTSLVSVAAVAAAAAAAATQNSTHYQQSFISPTTTVSFSEIPCSSSQHYVNIMPQTARGFNSSRSTFAKRPSYQFSFPNGIGSTKRRSNFSEPNETHDQIPITTSCSNNSNPNASNTTSSSTTPHCNIENSIPFTSSSSHFSHPELNGSNTSFVLSSIPQTEEQQHQQQEEEATVVAAAAVVASAAAHAVAAAAQAVSAAVHHRRASASSASTSSSTSSDQAFSSSQLTESLLQHTTTIPNQSIIHHPLMHCCSLPSPVECGSNYPLTNQLITPDLYHNEYSSSSSSSSSSSGVGSSSSSCSSSSLLHEHELNYRQSQLLANLSSSQSTLNPTNLLYSSMSIDDNRNDHLNCNSTINLHIPNICTGLSQLASSSMLHSIIPAFSTSNGLTLIRSTNEFINASYPIATVARITTTNEPDNNYEFTMHTSRFTGSHLPRSPHFITTPLQFSNNIESTLLNGNFSNPMHHHPSLHHQSSVYPNLTTMATEVAAAAAAVALAANHSSSFSSLSSSSSSSSSSPSSVVVSQCTTTDHSQINFLPNNIVSLTCGSSNNNPSFTPYLPPSFSSVTPIPLLPLRSPPPPPPQLSIIGSSTLATTRGVNTLLQFLRLIHQRPDSYALPYYPSAMTATAGGSNQSVVVSASAGIANGTRVASAVTPPLVPHHPIVPIQTSLLSTYTEGGRRIVTRADNLLIDNQQSSISSVGVQPITSAAAALAAAMAAAVALQQQNHRHPSSNAVSMLTPSRAAPTTPSIPVPILHAHLYYPRNVATVQQLHNAHQQCYHSHYGGVQHQNSASQRSSASTTMSNVSSTSGCLPISPVNSLFVASSVGVGVGAVTTSPACLTNLFPFLLAVPAVPAPSPAPPPPTLPLPLSSVSINNASSIANFAVSDLSETLYAHYSAAAAVAAAAAAADQSTGFSHGNPILPQTVSDPTSAATAAAAAAAVAAAAAAASVDTLLHLAVQLESNNGRGLSKEELDSLPIRLYTLKTSENLFINNDQQNTNVICNDELNNNTQNDDSPESDRCMICLDDYIESQQIRQMRCLHEFHANCVDKWLKTKRTCPLCRADAFTGSQSKDDYF
ncbi:unnamed protein product [Schistosoma turkestanicum]|nr:unnamed protein product [Schistosoma turkestanicum]